jgi:hypothetical protein
MSAGAAPGDGRWAWNFGSWLASLGAGVCCFGSGPCARKAAKLNVHKQRRGSQRLKPSRFRWRRSVAPASLSGRDGYIKQYLVCLFLFFFTSFVSSSSVFYQHVCVGTDRQTRKRAVWRGSVRRHRRSAAWYRSDSSPHAFERSVSWAKRSAIMQRVFFSTKNFKTCFKRDHVEGESSKSNSNSYVNFSSLNHRFKKLLNGF